MFFDIVKNIRDVNLYYCKLSLSEGVLIQESFLYVYFTVVCTIYIVNIPAD